LSALRAKIRYRVLPLPRVQREAQKLLNPQQLAEGIALAKRLRFYPDVPDLKIEPCGEGMELRLESKALNQQGVAAGDVLYARAQQDDLHRGFVLEEDQQGERRRPPPH